MVNSDGSVTTFVSDDWVPLSEAVVADDGTIPVCIVQKGWSKNGRYYPEEVLRAAAPLYRAGTHNLWNHPGPSALREQPNVDLNAIASVLVEGARYLAEGDPGAFKGPGLYARVRPISAYRDRILELAETIGLSHRINARTRPGEAEGRKGRIVTEILDPDRHPGIPKITVDWVAYPAAGGAPLVEEETESMTSEEISEQVAAAVKEAVDPLNEQIAAKDAEIKRLTEEVAGLRREQAVAAATAILREELEKAGLPEAAAKRLEKTLAPQGDEDPEEYRKTVAAAADDEKAYIAAVAPAPEDAANEEQTPPAAPNPGVRVQEGEGYLALVRELRAATGR